MRRAGVIEFARDAMPVRVLAVPVVALVATALLVSGCGTGRDDVGANAAATSRLVIVGGALQDDNDAVYDAILERRQGDGPFCVLPTASGVPDEAMASAIEAFRAHGAESVLGVALTTENAKAASDPITVGVLWDCSGFWFTGGVQSRVPQVFLPGGLPTSAYEAVMSRFREGAVVAGSSAGAAMMNATQIAGGTSAGALENGVVATEEQGGVVIEPGMGFFDRTLLDQHFLARGRVGRLIVATLAGVNGGIGIGIDENTALVVDGERARVAGASGAVLVDARGADRTDAAFGGRGVSLRLMGSGDEIDLGSFRVTTAAEKAPVVMGSDGVEIPEDPFARWAFLHLLTDLAASGQQTLELPAGSYRMTVEKAEGFEAVSYGTEGVQGTPFGLSVGPLDVSLVPGG